MNIKNINIKISFFLSFFFSFFLFEKKINCENYFKNKFYKILNFSKKNKKITAIGLSTLALLGIYGGFIYFKKRKKLESNQGEKNQQEQFLIDIKYSSNKDKKNQNEQEKQKLKIVTNYDFLPDLYFDNLNEASFFNKLNDQEKKIFIFENFNKNHCKNCNFKDLSNKKKLDENISKIKLEDDIGELKINFIDFDKFENLEEASKILNLYRYYENNSYFKKKNDFVDKNLKKIENLQNNNIKKNYNYFFNENGFSQIKAIFVAEEKFFKILNLTKQQEKDISIEWTRKINKKKN